LPTLFIFILESTSTIPPRFGIGNRSGAPAGKFGVEYSVTRTGIRFCQKRCAPAKPVAVSEGRAAPAIFFNNLGLDAEIDFT
jgi:hypothetical protein